MLFALLSHQVRQRLDFVIHISKCRNQLLLFILQIIDFLFQRSNYLTKVVNLRLLLSNRVYLSMVQLLQVLHERLIFIFFIDQHLLLLLLLLRMRHFLLLQCLLMPEFVQVCLDVFQLVVDKQIFVLLVELFKLGGEFVDVSVEIKSILLNEFVLMENIFGNVYNLNQNLFLVVFNEISYLQLNIFTMFFSFGLLILKILLSLCIILYYFEDKLLSILTVQSIYDVINGTFVYLRLHTNITASSIKMCFASLAVFLRSNCLLLLIHLE